MIANNVIRTKVQPFNGTFAFSNNPISRYFFTRFYKDKISNGLVLFWNIAGLLILANTVRVFITSVFFPQVFNLDGQIDEYDIEILGMAIQQESNDSFFNLDEDPETVDSGDRDHLIRNILGTDYGDANLDGLFDSKDLIQETLLKAIKYKSKF